MRQAEAMNALPSNVVDFKLPKKPKVREKEAPPDQRKVCVVPIKAIRDASLTDASIRVLAILCSYTNRAGITWVSQNRLAADMGVTKQAISKQFVKLKAAGYIEVVKRGFKGQRSDTIRVVFDESVDTATALAVTSRHEDNRSPQLKEQDMKKEQELTPDPEGLKRIQDMIKGVIKPMTQPPKEYVMPKSEDTITVAKMKKEIAAKKASKGQPIVNPEVVNVRPSHSQPKAVDKSHTDNHTDNQGVDHNLKNEGIDKVLNLFLRKGFNVLVNQEIVEVVAEHATVAELETLMDQLSERYASEGLALPTDGAVLADDLMSLQADQVAARYGV
jgi:hypothetical protein